MRTDCLCVSILRVASGPRMKFATVLSTSLGKTFFAWRFILNDDILYRLGISYQKPFVFSVSVFSSQICNLKLNLRPKLV